MPKVSPEYLELRRQHILDAAAICFARRGFHATTMQDICDEADVSPGALYRYFRGKEDIIQGICEVRQTQNAEAIDEAMAKGTTIAALDDLLRVFFLEVDIETFPATCALFLEMISESPRNERIRAMQRQAGDVVRGRLVELIKQSQAKGEFNPSLDPEAIARVMVALYHGFVTQKLVDPEYDVPAYTRVVQAMFGGSFWCAEPAGPVETGRAEPAALRH
jgi:AcrR family transcriptional regulator